MVTRGPVVEKFGRMIDEGKKTQPGRREGEIVRSRFYSLDGHAGSPLVGVLHATLVLQFYADGSASAVGWLGVMNSTRVDADMQRRTRSAVRGRVVLFPGRRPPRAAAALQLSQHREEGQQGAGQHHAPVDVEAHQHQE
jgi:hypothetical protein